VDQQEQYRRQQLRKSNQLPPVTQQSSSPMRQPREPNSEEMRFQNSMESLKAKREHMENQGFAMGKLTEEASHLADGQGGGV